MSRCSALNIWPKNSLSAGAFLHLGSFIWPPPDSIFLRNFLQKVFPTFSYSILPYSPPPLLLQGKLPPYATATRCPTSHGQLEISRWRCLRCNNVVLSVPRSPSLVLTNTQQFLLLFLSVISGVTFPVPWSLSPWQTFVAIASIHAI